MGGGDGWGGVIVDTSMMMAKLEIAHMKFAYGNPNA